MSLHPSLHTLLDNVLDAVVIIDRDGTVRGWNGIAEATFGWTREEAIGHSLCDLIVPLEHRSAHTAGMARFNASGEARVLNQRLRMTALTRSCATIPVELTITLVKNLDEGMFVGFLRDLSEQERADQQSRQLELESRLIFKLSMLAAETPTLDEAFEAALNAICELTGWPLGHAFIVADDGIHLQSRGWTSGAREMAAELVTKTEESRFALNVGLPGRILRDCRAEWIEDTGDAPDFPRKGLGFRSAFGFPVMSHGNCIAVLEFFARDARPPDSHILQLVQSLGAQVGRVFERRRTEERRQVVMGEVAHRMKNLIAVIQGIAHQTFRNFTTGKDDALQLFNARLGAIAQAQRYLFEDESRPHTLFEIVDDAVRGCGVDFERVGISGPELFLSPTASLMMSLAIHELSTNSFKYGALSIPSGNVAMTWEVSAENDCRFNLRWEESGGPRVETPVNSGFGHKILRRAIEADTGGRSELQFLPDGLVYKLIGANYLR